MNNVDLRIEAAQNDLEAGFLSEAARKRTLDKLNRAYEAIRDGVFDLVKAAAFAANAGDQPDDYAARNVIFRANDLPFDLHQVRDRHIDIIAKWAADHAKLVRDLIALRTAVKESEIVKVERKADVERLEAVRVSIVDEMKARHASYVEALDVGRHFGHLPVTVNAHWVHGHRGAQFVRHFFYLRGKLTALQVILAAADTLEREKAAG